MNENKKQQREDYNRTVGSDAQLGHEEPPVLNSVSPMMLLVVTLIVVAFLGLLGWGVIIVFGM
jgi:hypothetical protein